MATRQVAKSFEHRSNSTIAGTVYYRCNYHNPERTALISPTENIKWTYGELWGQVMAVAGGLTKAGYGPGSVIATDLDRTTESLLLQLATAHNGMLLLTVNNEAELKGNSVHVDGNVAASATSFLKGTQFRSFRSQVVKQVRVLLTATLHTHTTAVILPQAIVKSTCMESESQDFLTSRQVSKFASLHLSMALLAWEVCLAPWCAVQSSIFLVPNHRRWATLQ